MANVTTGNPFVIDTVTETAILAAGSIFKLFAVHWTSGSVADAVVVADAAGITKWASVGSVANNHEFNEFPDACPLVFNGLKVATLGAGTVKLYVRQLR